MALAEINTVLSRSDLTVSERDFFEQAQKNLQTSSDLQVQITDLKQHVYDMENIYHPDQQGNFARLWPEFAELL
jgi:hypothetical protein